MSLTRVSNFAFGLALVLYIVAMVGYFHHLAFRRAKVLVAASAITYAGGLAQLVSVVTRGLAAGRVPWGNMYEYSSMVGLLVVAGYLLVERLSKVRSLGGFALGAAVLAMAGATMVYVPAGPLVPALNPYWLRILGVAALTGFSRVHLRFRFHALLPV